MYKYKACLEIHRALLELIKLTCMYRCKKPQGTIETNMAPELLVSILRCRAHGQEGKHQYAAHGRKNSSLRALAMATAFPNGYRQMTKARQQPVPTN